MVKGKMTPEQKKGLNTVILGYFMVQFALVPVAAMLPSVSRDLGLTMTESGWIMAIYLLSLTGLLLISGRIGDQFGDKKVFTTGTVIFLVASIACGFAASYMQLFLFRAMQGIGTALMSGNALSIISKLFPEGGLRAHAFGKVTSAAAFGSLIGICISTIFLQFFSWRLIFWITIPMAILVLCLVSTVKEKKVASTSAKIDLRGALLIYVIIVSTVFYVSAIPDFGSCSPTAAGMQALTCQPLFPFVVPLVIIGLTLLLVRVERKAEQPILILHEFKNQLFVSSLGANFILHLAMINVTFFVPFLVEDGLGMAPVYAGIVLISVEFMNAIFPRIGGAIYDRTGSNAIRPVGMGIILSGFIIYWFVLGSTSLIPYILVGAWIGAGMGIFWSVNNNVIMNSIKGNYQGFASGMLETTRQMGHTFASAISAVAMTLGVMSSDASLQIHGHGSAGGGNLDASTIFDGSKNIIMVSILLALIGFRLAFYQERKASVLSEEATARQQQ